MITILQQPLKYAPAGNPILFKFSSDDAALVYFKVDIKEAISDAIIMSAKVFPTPAAPDTSFFNLSKALSSVVKYKFDNDLTANYLGKTSPVIGYILTITERGIVLGVFDDLHAPFVSDTFYAFDAQLDVFNLNYSLGANTHVIADAVTEADPITEAKFLTLSPNFKTVNDYSFEQLYFLNDHETTLIVVLYIFRPGASVYDGSYSIPDTNTFKMWKLNVSPKAFAASGLIADWVWMDGDVYTIQIQDTGGILRTEKRTYVYKTLQCHLEAVNICWVNSLGGIDSYQFINPQESINVTKSTIIKNPLRVGDSGIYLNDGIYNVQDEIYSSNGKSTIKVYTQELTDAEAKWLTEMVNSKQLYLELNNNDLVPISLVSKDYTIQRVKYHNTELNQYQFDFSFSDNILPALSNDLSIVINK